ncbi:phosphotransferase [Nocardia sp. NPDC046763]|uniref:phosphotransferase family protein n=1 Tax=Nocardia sp. NPDC046763 TaxID=3155256 RepID=UPI0033EE24EF
MSKLYSGLPAVHAARIRDLQVPPLERFWSPDPSQTTRRCVLVHSDLHPNNLLLNEAGVWILDWELAMAADPIWEAAVSLHRTPWPDADSEAHAAAQWLDLLADTDAEDPATLLDQYRMIETWKSLLVDSWRFPVAIAADPDCLDARAKTFHSLLSAGSENFGCVSLSINDVRTQPLDWAADTPR